MARRNFRRRRLEESLPSHNESAWLTSYCDMVSLLLCLFVVMYGMSKVNEGSFRQLADALSKNLQTGGGTSRVAQKQYSVDELIQGLKEKNGQKINFSIDDEGNSDIMAKTKDLSIIKEQLDSILEKRGISNAVDVRVEERGLVIGMMTDKAIFKLGEADLTSNSKEILQTISPIIKGSKNQIRIEGNTCNLPVFTDRFKSNWELSTMRATNVARALIQGYKINPERVSIIGFGESRPRFPNDNEKNRAKNRRVDIVILNGKYANGNAPPPDVPEGLDGSGGGFWDDLTERKQP